MDALNTSYLPRSKSNSLSRLPITTYSGSIILRNKKTLLETVRDRAQSKRTRDRFRNEPNHRAHANEEDTSISLATDTVNVQVQSRSDGRNQNLSGDFSDLVGGYCFVILAWFIY